MSWDDHTAARLSAYRLMEALQGDAHQAAAAGLLSLNATADQAGWADVSLLTRIGTAMYGVIRPDGSDSVTVLDEIVAAAELAGAPALLAHALGMRAIAAGSRGQTEQLLADAARGLVLLDIPTLPPLDACTALVVCAAAYNGQRLWELSDEIFDRASQLAPQCEEPIQDAAIAMNRVLLRLEWASVLFEQDDPLTARQQLVRAAAATERALPRTDLPAAWRAGLHACELALRLYLDPPDETGELLARLEVARAEMRQRDDVELLPLVETLVALALLRLGRPDAADWLDVDGAASATTGSRSFRLWAQAQVLLPDEPAASVLAWRRYAGMLAAQRDGSRRALLSAARSHLAGERLNAEHARLTREAASDPLTGLANRRAFDDWLERPRATVRPAALILLDLDDFKAVNDRHGHDVGDEVLRRVGRTVARHVRAQDLALRLGGDEFLVIIEGADDEDADTEPLPAIAGERADALRRAVVEEPWAQLDIGLSVTAAVGVATALVGDPGGAHALYRAADIDLYAGKAARGVER